MAPATSSVSTVSTIARHGDGSLFRSRLISRRLSAAPNRNPSTVRESFGEWRSCSRSAKVMPMGWVMVRRIGSIAAACAALLAGAVPAQASTLYTILGHGYGHGIGMSQYGTLGYALHGYSYDRILAHYFSNTSLGSAPSGVVERVLLESNRTVS